MAQAAERVNDAVDDLAPTPLDSAPAAATTIVGDVVASDVAGVRILEFVQVLQDAEVAAVYEVVAVVAAVAPVAAAAAAAADWCRLAPSTLL